MSLQTILVILDGWGINPDPNISAIAAANTPNFDRLWNKFPHASLEASGLAVGLPDGQMGNSEVGHTNLGAGRVVYQNLVKIGLAVKENRLGKEPQLIESFKNAKINGDRIHIMGLMSDGGIHSHWDHAKSIISAAHEYGIKNIFVHAFTDGRDCDPHSGIHFITDLQDFCTRHGAKIATVCGRYFSMDRDKRWDRVAVSYNALVHAEGIHTKDIPAEIKKLYAEKSTDEFIPAIINGNDQDEPIATIQDKDTVVFFNFRTDRGRQLTEVLTQKPIPDHNLTPLDLHFTTMTYYDETFTHVHSIFKDDVLKNTLGEVISNQNLTQIRTAETEKYPHVTFFFSGGREKVFDGERRILAKSPQNVATYDKCPEMAARDITASILPEIKGKTADFICLNYANTDMVGHTGDFAAAQKAAEVVDSCLGELVETALKNDYLICILADHGNSDVMKNPDGSPNTQHSTNKVPLIIAHKNSTFKVVDGKLGDIAPSILNAMSIEIPKEMTGNIIFKA